MKSGLQAVGHVQPQPVDAEFPDPPLHAAEQMPGHLFVSQVELHELVMAFPSLVPQSVVIPVVAVETDEEPIPVGGSLPIFQQVLERPEAPAHVVEHPVEHHPDPRLVKGAAKGGEFAVRSQPAVDPGIVPGIVAVRVGVEHRRKIDRIRMDAPYMGDPVCHFLQTVARHTLVLVRAAAEAQGIDLIKDTVISPHDGTAFPRGRRPLQNAHGVDCIQRTRPY